MTKRGFYLAGGTALAIYLGHRVSIDLDWFTPEKLEEPLRLAQELRDDGIPFVTSHVERGTLYGTVAGVKVSFLEYRYPLLKPLVAWPDYNCTLAAIDDIACMKLSAIAQRGARKDFLDIYGLGLHRDLRELLRLYQEKYGVADIGHILYGLAYFDEADRERMPKMRWKVAWKTVKQAIRVWIRHITD